MTPPGEAAHPPLGFGYAVARAFPRETAAALGLLLLASVTEGVSIILLAPILHMLGPAHTSVSLRLPWGGGTIAVSLGQALCALTLIVIGRAWLMRAKEVRTADLLHLFVNRLREDLFASVARARWAFVSRARASDLNHALTADIDRVQIAFYQLLALVQTIVLILAYTIVSLFLSPVMTLLAAGLGGGMLVLLRPIRRRAIDYGRDLSGHRQDQYRIAAEFLAGLKVAKSFNAEPRYMRELADALAGVRAGTMRFMRMHTTGSAVFQSVSVVALCLFIWVALIRFGLSLPQIVVMLLLFMRLAPRFAGLQGNLQEFLVNVAAYDVMQRLRERCDAERESWDDMAAVAPRLDRALSFEDVGFRYGDAEGEAVLAHVSFTVPAGRITALIGPSGGGKSTVADLMIGLLEPSGGRVLVDGVPLDAHNRRHWRGQVAYVPQDVFLIHDSVAANLRLAVPQAREPEMWEALRRAGAFDLVQALPDRLATIVGERGIRLSGGERQRIALARALLHEPRLLILDEATSALDWETQAAIARSIRSLRGEMTIVTIAHRLSMIAFADTVIVLQGGGVVESGGYEELARDRGSRLRELIDGEHAAGTDALPAGTA